MNIGIKIGELKIGKKKDKTTFDWELHLHYEYVLFASKIEELSQVYNWNFWGGGKGNYALTLSQNKKYGKSISVRMCGFSKYQYYVSFINEWNPNNVHDYHELIGKTMEEAIQYIENFLKENMYTSEDDRYCFMGNAYDSFWLDLKWAKERL